MPCAPAVARLLLKDGKAKVRYRTPFTIQLVEEMEAAHTQPLTHGMDTGSSAIGSAVVTLGAQVLYRSEITVRNDINARMMARAAYRRNRRSRKTRYRPARFNNRGNSRRDNRLPPTVTSKIQSHLREVAFVQKLLPITRTVLETASFDPHALKDPSLLDCKSKYRFGVNYGFANTKAYVLHRDGYTCQHCKGKSKSRRLQVHHLVYRSCGGADTEDNLLTLCDICHRAVHAEKVILKHKGRKKVGLAAASQMNTIRVQLIKRLTYAEETFGFVTKEHRQVMGLVKSHSNDAVAIAHGDTSPVEMAVGVLHKRCVNRGDYQQTKGVHSQLRIPTGKIRGFRKFDKVRYQGQVYFIRGRMSTGYAQLLDAKFNPVKLKPIPKLALMKRLSARKSWIMHLETTASIC